MKPTPESQSPPSDSDSEGRTSEALYRSFPDFDDWGQLSSQGQETWTQLASDLVSFSEGSDLRLAPVEGYRSIKRTPPPFIKLRIESLPPAEARVNSWIRILVSLDSSKPFPFLVQADKDLSISVRLEDAHPEVSSSLRVRFQSLTEQLLGELLALAEKQAAKSLKK